MAGISSSSIRYAIPPGRDFQQLNLQKQNYIRRKRGYINKYIISGVYTECCWFIR